MRVVSKSPTTKNGLFISSMIRIIPRLRFLREKDYLEESPIFYRVNEFVDFMYIRTTSRIQEIDTIKLGPDTWEKKLRKGDFRGVF